MKSIPRKFLLFLILFSFSCRAILNSTPFNSYPNSLTSETPQTLEDSGNQGLPITELPKDEQLEIFTDLWQVVNEEYLYEDFNGMDWDQSFLDTKQLINSGLSTNAFYKLMDQLIISLGDDHSIFLTPAEVEEEAAEYYGNSDYVGIGVWITSAPERNLATIILVFQDSPAEEAGLKAHDNILQVDGNPVLDEEGVITESILGIPGTSVTITVQTPGEAPRDIQLTREKILGSFPIPYQILDIPNKKIGYLFIPTFTEESIDDRVSLALHEMGKLDGLIIDNRYNGGGFSNVTMDTLSYFTKGDLGHFINRSNNELLRITPKNIFNSQHLPLVVLVGEGTASFGEIFSGILQVKNRAYLIGETTDGNVETLYGYDFQDGSRVWIAHDVFIPIGDPLADWENNGIIPDFHSPNEWDLVTLETDPAILAAIEYFDSLD